jgi:hypothetical protein
MDEVASDVPTVEGATGEEPTPVGLISSGTSERPTPRPEPERPEGAAQNRGSSLSQAMEGVPFTVLEPKDLPADAHRDLIHRIESDTAPGVRFIYSMESGGSIVVLQTAATGAAAEGDEVAVGAHTGWRSTNDSTTLLVWEQDGVRLELRGLGVADEILLAAAASMAPADPSGSDTGGSLEGESPVPTEGTSDA